MTIETKYNLQDKVFRMWENKVTEDIIEEIVVRAKKHGDAEAYHEESYILKYGGGGFTSDKFYPTKEALLQSL